MFSWFLRAPKQAVARYDVALVPTELRRLGAELSKKIQADDLAPETLLFSGGLLDSLAFIDLVMRVEEHFGIELGKVVEVTPSSFDRFGDLQAAVTQAVVR